MQHVTHFFGGVGAGKCHQRPECDARTHDVLPVVPVAQVSKERSQEHVTADENWKETNRKTSSGLIKQISPRNTGASRHKLSLVLNTELQFIKYETVFILISDINVCYIMGSKLLVKQQFLYKVIESLRRK